MVRPRAEFRKIIFGYALALTLVLAAIPLVAQDPDKQNSDKNNNAFDARTSVGDVHVGKDADAKTAGLPLYPRARPKREKDNDPLNFGIATESFGLKIVVAKYESDDDPAKIIGFYRDKLRKYGKVLECHAQEHGGVDVHDSQNSDSGKQLKCDDNAGPVTELKAGSEDDQHVVAIEPRDNAKGSTFTLVYIYKHGKKGEL